MPIAKYVCLCALACAGICAAAWLLANLYIGLVAPIIPKRKIRPARNPAQQCRRAYVAITLHTADGVRLRGWYVPGAADFPTVIICHPYESSKYSSLHRLGLLPLECPALLVDGRAHGESDGEKSCFLFGELLDIAAMLDYGIHTLGKERFVLWGRCWNNLALANLAAQRSEVCALILEGAVPSLWQASTEALRQRYPLPPWCLYLAMLLLEWRWGRGAFSEPLDALGAKLQARRVLLISEKYHAGSMRYAKQLIASWPQVHIAELCLPSLHGGITDLAAATGPYRTCFSAAIHALIKQLNRVSNTPESSARNMHPIE